MIPVLVVCLVAAVTKAHPVTFFTDCGSETGTLNSLDVSPCLSNPCQIPRGNTVTTTFNITSNAEVTTAEIDVHAKIANRSRSVLISYANACASMTCPVNNQQTVMYHDYIFIERTTPELNLTVKVEIKDQNGDNFICVEYPVEIVDEEYLVCKDYC